MDPGGSTDRRSRYAQRGAVDDVLSDSGQVALFRTAGGDVLVYDEYGNKFRPVKMRAVVMPDGSTRLFETGRFGRFHRARR